MCDHNPTIKPITGCSDCDNVINRPIPKRFGLGNSSQVLPRPKTVPEDENQK